jgi:hypothetical protein
LPANPVVERVCGAAPEFVRIRSRPPKWVPFGVGLPHNFPTPPAAVAPGSCSDRSPAHRRTEDGWAGRPSPVRCTLGTGCRSVAVCCLTGSVMGIRGWAGRCRFEVGQAAALSMGCEPAVCSWPPHAGVRVCREHGFHSCRSLPVSCPFLCEEGGVRLSGWMFIVTSARSRSLKVVVSGRLRGWRLIRRCLSCLRGVSAPMIG